MKIETVSGAQHGWIRVVGCLGWVWVSVATASAQVVHLNAIRTGAYTSDGWFDAHNYITGIPFAYGAESRGMVVFDLSGVSPGTVTAAVLTLQNPYTVNEVGNADLELRLHQLSSMDQYNMGIPNTFSAIHTANFAYLGASPVVGTTMVPVHPSGPPNSNPVVFNLTGAVLGDLQSALGNDDFYAFGLRVIKADAEEPKPLQYIFGGTALGGQVTLDLTVVPVPEPSTGWLLGLVALGTARALKKTGKSPSPASRN